MTETATPVDIQSLLADSKAGGVGNQLLRAMYRPSRVLAVLGTPLDIFGRAGAADQTVVSFTIPGGTIAPNSVLVLATTCKFLSNGVAAGKSVKFLLGGQALAQVFPNAGMTSFNGEIRFFVAPDLQTLYAFSQNWNDVQSPATGQGAPYSSSSAHSTVSISIDMTADQTFQILMKPLNGDEHQLTGFSLENIVSDYPPAAKLAVSSALGCWGDSMTAGTGSVAAGGFFLTQAGTTTNASAVVTVPSTAGVLAGMVITGPGIPPDTTVLSFVANTSITMSAPAGAGAGAGVVEVIAGAWPQQLKYLSAGRPVWNSGIGALTSTAILALMQRDKVRGRLWTDAIWVGRNDVGIANFQSTVLNNIAAMIANLAAGTKFVVLTVTPLISETTGTVQNIAINALNAAIIAKYGNLVVDVNALLCTQGDGTVNTLYRATGGDTVHLNDLGYSKVAAAVNAKLIALGA